MPTTPSNRLSPVALLAAALARCAHAAPPAAPPAASPAAPIVGEVSTIPSHLRWLPPGPIPADLRVVAAQVRDLPAWDATSQVTIDVTLCQDSRLADAVTRAVARTAAGLGLAAVHDAAGQGAYVYEGRLSYQGVRKVYPAGFKAFERIQAYVHVVRPIDGKVTVSGELDIQHADRLGQTAQWSAPDDLVLGRVWVQDLLEALSQGVSDEISTSGVCVLAGLGVGTDAASALRVTPKTYLDTSQRADVEAALHVCIDDYP